MEFFGNTLTATGDIVKPGKLILDPEDETTMRDIQNIVDKDDWFMLGNKYAIFNADYLAYWRNFMKRPLEFKYWVANRYDKWEEVFGYNTIKDAIADNFDKIHNKNQWYDLRGKRV